jgi:hypothetical protein
MQPAGLRASSKMAAGAEGGQGQSVSADACAPDGIQKLMIEYELGGHVAAGEGGGEWGQEGAGRSTTGAAGGHRRRKARLRSPRPFSCCVL